MATRTCERYRASSSQYPLPGSSLEMYPATVKIVPKVTHSAVAVPLSIGNGPGASPSAGPSASPSGGPSASRSAVPSAVPSVLPSAGPNRSPSGVPSASPSGAPSAEPSGFPSAAPGTSPSRHIERSLQIER
jgi:hypothetical protein